MIAKTIKTIYKKNTLQGLEGLLTAKISEKKYFTRFWRGYLQQKYQIIFFFFVFPIYKEAKCKNGCYYQRNI